MSAYILRLKISLKSSGCNVLFETLSNFKLETSFEVFGIMISIITAKCICHLIAIVSLVFDQVIRSVEYVICFSTTKSHAPRIYLSCWIEMPISFLLIIRLTFCTIVFHMCVVLKLEYLLFDIEVDFPFLSWFLICFRFGGKLCTYFIDYFVRC